LALELFWLLAGMMVTLAAVILLLPWLRKIPSLGPLPSVPWPILTGAAVALVAVVGLYLKWGRPDLAHPSAASVAPMGASTTSSPGAASSAAKPGGTQAAGSMFSAISGLQGRLAKGGGTPDDWELLAKSYEFLGQPENAAKVRKHELPPLPSETAGPPVAAVGAGAAALLAAAAAPKLTPDTLQWLAKADAARRGKKLSLAASIYVQLAARNQMTADSWADYADTAATLQGSKLAGAPESYIAKALALDPQNAKALWLRASAEEEAGRYASAVVAWQQLQGRLAPDSPDAKIVAASLQRDQGLLSGAGAATVAPAAPGTTVSGEISIAPPLAGKAEAGTTLFIVAKAADGAGIPVAVLRQAVARWPVKFTLSDALSMMPGRSLSTAGKVIVEARVSRSGEALRAPGDLLGSSGVINPADHRSLKIQIAEVVK
jgi:cytochrome c-type biogenesis protein CcmH